MNFVLSKDTVRDIRLFVKKYPLVKCDSLPKDLDRFVYVDSSNSEMKHRIPLAEVPEKFLKHTIKDEPMKKQLDEKALEYIKNAKANKKDYDKICKELTQQGYRRPSGAEYHRADISRFACDNGLRIKTKTTRKKEDSSKVVITTADLTLKVINSGKLTNEEKMKVLENII